MPQSELLKSSETSKTQSSYSENASEPLTWDDIHRQKQWGTCPNEHVARFAKRYLQEGAFILDIGCGIGANAIWLASEGYTVWAIDISGSAIGRLLGRKPLGKRVFPQTASATVLPYGDNSFDAAIEVCVLQHLSEVDAALALKEAFRVLRPGGQMFSVAAKFDHSVAAFPDGIYTRLLSWSDICGSFKDNGFMAKYISSSKYDDEKYGTIAHWLVRARKP